MKNQYIQNQYNRKRNIYHFNLGLEQMTQHPYLFVPILSIILLTIYIWIRIDDISIIIEFPKTIFFAFKIVAKVSLVFISFISCLGVINVIGNLTALKDEVTVQMVFRSSELRNGSPILMHKRKNKQTGVTIREWYSPIPMKVWIERQEEIADAMNIHFVEKLRYGGKSNGNRILMCSGESRKATERGELYDDEF